MSSVTYDGILGVVREKDAGGGIQVVPISGSTVTLANVQGGKAYICSEPVSRLEIQNVGSSEELSRVRFTTAEQMPTAVVLNLTKQSTEAEEEYVIYDIPLNFVQSGNEFVYVASGQKIDEADCRETGEGWEEADVVSCFLNSGRLVYSGGVCRAENFQYSYTSCFYTGEWSEEEERVIYTLESSETVSSSFTGVVYSGGVINSAFTPYTADLFESAAWINELPCRSLIASGIHPVSVIVSGAKLVNSSAMQTFESGKEYCMEITGGGVEVKTLN